MTHEPANRYRSPIIGDLYLPPADPGQPHPAGTAGPGAGSNASGPDPDARVPMLIELNVRYPGGLRAVRQRFYQEWRDGGFERTAGGTWPEDPDAAAVQPPLPARLALIAPKLYQCVLTRRQLRELVARDRREAVSGQPPAIFRVWPDYELHPQIDRSASTVKADAAWRSYDARGRGIVWAVIDSGIEGAHPHFSALELSAETAGRAPAGGLTSALHRDFSYLVNPDNPDAPPPPAAPPGPAAPAAAPPTAGPPTSGPAPAAASAIATATVTAPAPAVSAPSPGAPAPVVPPAPPAALTDQSGHGTHVAGIIAGCAPASPAPRVAVSKDPGGGYVARTQTGQLSGMAPACELVSLKVMRLSSTGNYVTSSSAVIRALTFLRAEVNVDPAVLRVHGVNMSLGCDWSPDQYAAGQSPLCQAVNQLIATGVVVVVSAGNNGASAAGSTAGTAAVLGSITEPAHAEDCIAAGSTHRDAPHVFGVTWTSSKGPTLDGRMKPDVVAPGEWITSAVSGTFRSKAGLDPAPGDTSPDRFATYAEESGTSMAAPHVSGVIAAFLSARPEFIGRPGQVKSLLMQSATDLGRERYAQGAGLVDLMRMLASV
jgi:subtilisin family serine protease